MDRPPSDRRDSRGEHLGTHRFAYHQPDSAHHGENHGHGCPVAYVPWQWTIQRPRPVYFGAGALLRGDCRRNPEFFDPAQTKTDSQQAGKGNPNSSSAYGSAAGAVGDCASASPRTSATTGPYSSPRYGHSDSGRPTPDGKPVVKPILVAA